VDVGCWNAEWTVKNQASSRVLHPYARQNKFWIKTAALVACTAATFVVLDRTAGAVPGPPAIPVLNLPVSVLSLDRGALQTVSGQAPAARLATQEIKHLLKFNYPTAPATGEWNGFGPLPGAFDPAKFDSSFHRADTAWKAPSIVSDRQFKFAGLSGSIGDFIDSFDDGIAISPVTPRAAGGAAL
jgi:hypothetical protein